MPIDIDGPGFEELLEPKQRVAARLKMLESVQAHTEMMAFNLVRRASFAHQAGRILGAVVKYDRKTASVLSDNGQRWNISPHLLSPVKDAGSAQPKSLKNKRLR